LLQHVQQQQLGCGSLLLLPCEASYWLVLLHPLLHYLLLLLLFHPHLPHLLLQQPLCWLCCCCVVLGAACCHCQEACLASCLCLQQLAWQQQQQLWSASCP
jgi:hypothetical protein